MKLEPRLPHQATVLAPFATLEEVARTVPAVVASGVAPSVLEYLDALAMGSITAAAGLELGVPESVAGRALAYLVVVVESTHVERLEADVETVATMLAERGALDVYVLPPTAGRQPDRRPGAGLLRLQGRRGRRPGRHGGPPGGHPRLPGHRGRAGRRPRRAGLGVRPRGRRQRPPLGLPARRRAPAPTWCGRSSPRRWPSGAPSRASTASASTSSRTSSSWRTRSSWPSCARIKAAFDPHGILGPGRLLDPPAAVDVGEGG